MDVFQKVRQNTILLLLLLTGAVFLFLQSEAGQFRCLTGELMVRKQVFRRFLLLKRGTPFTIVSFVYKPKG